MITSYNYIHIGAHQEYSRCYSTAKHVFFYLSYVKLKRLWTNSPVLQHLYWRSVPCVQLCNIWILQLSSEAIYNTTVNTSTFNASQWILEWPTSSFTFSSQKVLSKSVLLLSTKAALVTEMESSLQSSHSLSTQLKSSILIFLLAPISHVH